MTIELDERSVKKINLIDKFRERFSVSDNEKLKLPQIIVVGDQSSGKSSILEAISGVKLPRGVNTVTKCPVIIQMRHSDTVERKQIKCKDGKFEEIENTEKEINRVQREILKNQMTEEPITLHIESPNVQTLTIIDLPGIVKTQTSDQATGIIEMTHNIAKMYMSQENSLIICVLPANQDISTTTTIKLASECNKNKSRIIGVLTKLDKIDDKEASMIPDILLNKKLPIKKGFYALIVSDEFLELDSVDRQNFEKNSFLRRNLWVDEHKNRLGLNKFIAALVRELMILINERLPQLSSNIKKEIKDTENDLSKFSKYYENQAFRTHYIMQISTGIVTKVESIFVNADNEIQNFPEVAEFLESKNYLNPIEPHSTFLYLWHLIFKRLYDGFRTRFQELFEMENAPYKDLKSLDDLIKQCRIENVLVFNNSKPFKLIVDKILILFKQDSLKTVETCCEIIEHLIHKVLIDGIEEQFRVIKTDVLEVCLDILECQHKEIIDLLDSIFESEHSYFTQDAIAETFTKDGKDPKDSPMIELSNLGISQSGNKSSVKVNGTSGGDSKAANNDGAHYKHAQHLKACLDKYIENLTARLGDSVPNLIRLSLFVNFKRAVESQLSLTLLAPDRLEKYFNLDGLEEEEWDRLKEKLRLLKQSKTELDDLMQSTH